MDHILYSLGLSTLSAAFWALVFSSASEVFLITILINFVVYWFGYGLMHAFMD